MADRHEGTPAIKCHLCQSTFARQEHLTRHIRSHTREKPYKCAKCAKCFSRLDVLNRHTSSHTQDLVDVQGASSRACKECAASRVRCSKGNPCKRCLQRSLECSYPVTGKRKASSTGGLEVAKLATHALSDASEPHQLTPAAESAPSRQQVQYDIAAEEASPEKDGMETGKGMNGDNTGRSDANPSIIVAINESSWVAGVDQVSGSELPPENFGDSFPTDHLCDPVSGQGFDSQVMAMSAVNWLSPQYQNTLDWDNQLLALSSGGIGADDIGQYFPFSAIEPVRGSPWRQDMDVNLQSLESATAFTSEEQGHGLIHVENVQSISAKSATDSNASRSTEGRLYVEGTAGRAPFRGQLLHRQPIMGVASLEDSTAEASTPLSHISVPADSDGQNHSQGELVSEYAYDNMLRGIRSEVQMQRLSLDFTSIPSLAHIRVFSRLYFERFHPTYPFLRHEPSLFDQTENWVLLLTVSAVGARYYQESQIPYSKDILINLGHKILIHRFPRTSVVDDQSMWIPLGPEPMQNHPDLPTLQAGILNLLCTIHSGNKGLVEKGLVERYYLVDGCKRLNLLSRTDHQRVSYSTTGRGAVIADWLDTQSRIRTGMMIWLLDSIFAYEFNCAPLLQLCDAESSLPCPEDLWRHPTVERITNEASKSVTIMEALEMLHMQKRLPPNLGELSSAVLIYAICRKTKEVIYQQSNLSTWVPNARIQSRTASEPIAETWPPSLPILSKWRNSACDCLDILHWNANSTAAKAIGWEHPTILHLHLSRLLMLTPTQHMQIVAGASTSIASSRVQDNAQYMEACSHLRQWAIRDQFKARLSMIHAGSLLWHVRRYSSDSFLEPFAIYIATLVIWSYSVSTQSIRRQGEPDTRAPDSGGFSSETNSRRMTSPGQGTMAQTPDEDTDEDPEPAFIHLDRPCDDEMVQTYVRLGHKMSGYMLRVGNICSPGAPLKILQEGVRLLLGKPDKVPGKSHTNAVDANQEGLIMWGIERSFLEVLRCLMRATEN